MGYYVMFSGIISAGIEKQRRVFVCRVKQSKQQRCGTRLVGQPGRGSFTGTFERKRKCISMFLFLST
jgi:hypothetical protein